MKKQFNRMRQLANQTVGRAEKTEVLSDDLLQIERRMELVRLVSHNTHKRLVTCLQGQLGTDTEKRHKKLPLTTLSQAMQEGGGQLGEESLIGKMMDVCGEAENKLATELMQHELQIERDILDPLNQLAEVEIPNIMKQRKQLAKLVLDYDSAKTRWFQAAKSNNQAMAAKVDSLKDEMDEALNKVEQCKADYHRRSLAALEAAIPTIQMQQDSWTEKPAFGTALEEHLKKSNREIALPIEACVMMLLETGMKEELEEFYSDPHAVAGALKSYLRELPEPLMTFGLYDEWLQASNVSDPDKRLQALWVTCDRLPKTHKANLRYLVKFLAKLAQDSEVNKMTPSNIAIVLGPNLLWAKTEGTLAEMAAATSVHVVAIIEPIIQHADWFFPEEVDFNVSGMFAMPTHPATPDPEPGLDRKRPGSQAGQDGDSHTPRKDRYLSRPNLSLSLPLTLPSRPKTLSRQESRGPAVSALYVVADESITVTETPTEDLPSPDFKAVPQSNVAPVTPVTNTVNKQPEPAPRRANTVNRKQPQLTSPTFQPPLPPLEAWVATQPEPQPQAPSPAVEVEQPGMGAVGSGAAAGGGGGLGGGAQVATVHPQIVTQLSAEESSPARELMSTPPPQRNGSAHLAVGTPHSQGGSRGPSPHMVRRGTKKPAPAPPKQASPFASNPSNTQTPSSSHYPPISPRRHPSKEALIHAPSHPPPQPPQPHQAQGEPEPSPPALPPLRTLHLTMDSTPTRCPPTTPDLSLALLGQLQSHDPPAANDSGNGLCSTASKIITDGGLILKGVGRALVPEVIVDHQAESSAGQERASTPDPPLDANIQAESTALSVVPFPSRPVANKKGNYREANDEVDVDNVPYMSLFFQRADVVTYLPTIMSSHSEARDLKVLHMSMVKMVLALLKMEMYLIRAPVPHGGDGHADDDPRPRKVRGHRISEYVEGIVPRDATGCVEHPD
ncbi:hypothetical protein INR49_016050, partial [Caranx melampygus]